MPDETKGASDKEVKPKPKKVKRKATSPDVSRIVAARETEPGVAMRSLWPGRLIVLEEMVPSGKRYEFSRAGAEAAVAQEDVATLLERHRTAGCCGSGQVKQPFFELV